MAKLILKPLKGHKYQVEKAFSYQSIQVPAGFITNGANIPRILWSIWPPNKSDFMKAIVVHDYLCDRKKYLLADQLFKEALQEAEASKLTVWLFHTSVNLYHRLRYPSHYTKELR